MLLRTLWLSLDPYMRGRMSDATSYAKPVGTGDVMEGGTGRRFKRRRDFEAGFEPSIFFADTSEHRPSCIVDVKLRFGRDIGRGSNQKFG
jgi:hypothetical protein